MKALVTGARGFIGSFLVETLIQDGVKVRCLLRSTESGWLQGLDYEQVTGDITVPESLPSAVENIDIIYHLAGCTKAVTRRQYDHINAGGARNLLEATLACNSQIKRFILVSSLAAAGPSRDGTPLSESDHPRPVSDYGRSKLKSEETARFFIDKLPITILRPPAVYGPRDTDVYSYFKYAKMGIRPMLGGGPRSASFIYVKDLVAGIVTAAKASAAVGQTYYLCDDKAYTWDELGLTIAQALDVKTRKLPVPLPLAWPIAAIADGVARLSNRPSILSLDKFRELKMNHWICSNEKAKREFGFLTRHTLQQGIAETAKWYQKHGWL